MVKTRPGGRGPALSQRRAGPARPETRGTNARAAEHAGTGRFQMSLIRDTKPAIYPYHEAWARENGYRGKAASRKQEAASRKRQAPSTHSLKPQALTIQKSQAN